MKNVEDFYPLSPMQQGMFFHSQYDPESGVYVEQVSCTLRGNLDTAAFERAWQQIMQRHAILRTSFIGGDLKETVQLVHREVQLPLAHHDWRDMPAPEQDERLDALLLDDRQRGFDLARPPLMRLALIRTQTDAYSFVWTHHHILLDGWSVPLLLNEFFACYEAYSQQREPQLITPRPYRAYITWLKQQDTDRAEAFWRQVLQGFHAPTPFTVDQGENDAADEQPGYREVSLIVPQATTDLLKEVGREQGITMSTLVHGAWALLLSRYSSESDIIFGSTVSGRPTALPNAEYMIGLFINTLPVRAHIVPDTPVAEWLRALQAHLTEIRQYEYTPLVDIQRWSEVRRGLPLFESIIVFENYPVSSASFGEDEGSLSIADIRSFEQTNYPLTIAAGVDEELVVKLIYDTTRFSAEVIERLRGHLDMLLSGIAANPQQRLGSLPLLTDAERHHLLIVCNDTARDLPIDQCIHHLIDEQAARAPEAVALICEEDALSYAELTRRANQLAHYLQQRGVGPDVLVGISAERSIEMIVGILGILKAGGAYVPLDPAYPPERLAFMLRDTQAPILLTQTHLVEQLPAHSGQTIYLDTDWDAIAQQPDTAPARAATSRNLAYCIYTSGSTGQPKGVLIEHRSLCNITWNLIDITALVPGSRMLQFGAFSFDASVAEIFTTLVNGATLVLVRQVPLGEALTDVLRAHRTTVVILPPSLLAVMEATNLPDLQTIGSAAERCGWEIAERWGVGRRFINGYGPTETTVGPCFYTYAGRVPGASSVPIGQRPFANMQLYILDAQQQPVPVGVPGELYIGGVQLARGYHNRPELTAERFVPNPFSDEPGARLYRTGDLVRRLPDDSIEFVGRIDQQVKLRGFRIELGEIEAVLAQHPAVADVVVLVREDTPGNAQLVAYVVATENQTPASSDLRAFLQGYLPAHMIPAAFVMLEAFPLTPTNKVDRKALPAPDYTPGSDAGQMPPRDAIELYLMQVWEEVLEVSPIGVRDNFFELGGHSLIALRLMTQVQKRFSRPIMLADLFQNPTIEHLATLLRNQDNPVRSSPLITFRRTGTRPPLFFIHPSGGSVHWYTDLSVELGAEQPFYGLQAQGLYGDQPLHTRIEEMAACYIEAIRSVQPHGPYLIGSWSMGVIIAYEVAQQLQRQDEEIGLLAIFDHGPVLPTPAPEDHAAYVFSVFSEHMPLSLEQLREYTPQGQIEYIWQEARRIDWIYPEFTLEQFRHFVHLLRTHTEAWRAYEPQPYPGKVTLFRARQQAHTTATEPDMGWGALAQGGVEIHEVRGDHIAMIHPPHVRGLARKLRACLERIPTYAAYARTA
jgi:amino acid adenylation domain-containing protein